MVDTPETSERDRSDAEDAIMRATYRALCEHGYAELTMRAIAEEYGKTAAAIHYHYETKDELLVAFLEYLLDQFAEDVREVGTDDPAERLGALLDRLLVERADDYDFMVALLEMRAQAPYEDAIRAQFVHNDEYVRSLVSETIADAMAQGVFADDLDPERATRALMTIVDGARTRFVVYGREEAMFVAREMAAAYVSGVLEA